MFNEQHLAKYVDKNILEAVIECNRKGLVSVDACAGFGGSKSMAGRNISKYHCWRCFPYVTFKKIESDDCTFNALCHLLQDYVITVKPFAHETKLFDIDRSDLLNFDKYRSIQKYRIGMPLFLAVPMLEDGFDKKRYRKRLYNAKKRWNKLFLQAIKEV